MKHQFLILLLCLGQSLFAQNLLLNGSFEQAGSIQGLWPFQTFEVLEAWYPSGKYINGDTITDGTPDFFDDNFPRAQVEPLGFWNINQGASEGDKYIGMFGAFQYEGYITVEAIGSPLIEPLEAGALYHVGFDVRNLGITNQPDLPELCVPTDFKSMNVYFDTDSIFVYNEPCAEFSYSTVPQTLSLLRNEMRDFTFGGWNPIGSCSVAEGGENHFAISMRTGHFTVDPLCTIQDLFWKKFYTYYYNM